MNLVFENYTVSFDTYNATLIKHYVGKEKDSGEPKQMSKIVGHYNPNILHSGKQLIDVMLREGVSGEGELSLKEFKQFLDVKEEDVKKWVKEVIDEKSSG